MRSIVLATRNPGKLREIQRVLADLDVRVTGLDEAGGIAEPEETGQTFAENARQKALYYARATGQWCLADDSGLVVDALGGAPGVYSARYAAADCPPSAGRETLDHANNARLLRELAETPEEKRTARFVCCLALAAEDKILIEADGVVEGRIAREKAGENGFGYDPLFFVPELGCTTAQLSPEQKNSISHRGRAVRRFAELLKTHLTRT
ncbi:MAG: XTP/dITP diphosphatase [Phycisphaerae bacterium]|nr:XTP/dITP diphosphatase [Phycisphaerae bacterium]